MAEIVVHRCKLHIRRTSGWAWGASPDDLIRAATRAIPELLASRLPELDVPAGASIVVERPIRVNVSATVRQLVALGDAATGTQDVVELRARITADVAAAVAAAISRDGVSAVAPAPRTAAEDALPGEPEAALAAELANADAPRRAVRAWFRAKTIDAVLERMEPSALARLHEWLLGEPSGAAAPGRELEAIVERIAAAQPAQPETPIERVTRRIALAAAALDASPLVPPAQLRAAIDHVVPLDGAVAAGVARSAREAPPVVPAPHVHAGEVTVRSALPFLLLSPLHHAGWLASATALIAVHGREEDAFAFAAGLAAKVLEPLERGWARSPADRLAIAVFAGRTEPIPDAEIVTAAANLRPLFASLDTTLRSVIARARQPVPAVLWRDDRGWYLLDGDGFVVLAASPDLGVVLAAAPNAPILVSERFATREVFDTIDYANARFITDAPPGRGDTWRSFVGATRRLYTNDTATPTGKLVALTAHLEHAVALADELVEVLSTRPAVPRDPLSAFDATCTLAATAALADIGARLFPGESTTPVLALTRFGDLDARVTFEPDRVRVRVPLGRRHAELFRHGILGELAGVPWMAGRTVDMAGG